MGEIDDMGFDEVWVGEHHSNGSETISSPDMFLAAAAEHTKHVRLGTGVASLSYHHPFISASRIAQLDNMTRGRVIFGTGPGKLPLDAHMMGIDTAIQRRRQREALEAIMPLLRGETVSMALPDKDHSTNEGRVPLQHWRGGGNPWRSRTASGWPRRIREPVKRRQGALPAVDPMMWSSSPLPGPASGPCERPGPTVSTASR